MRTPEMKISELEGTMTPELGPDFGFARRHEDWLRAWLENNSGNTWYPIVRDDKKPWNVDGSLKEAFESLRAEFNQSGN